MNNRTLRKALKKSRNGQRLSSTQTTHLKRFWKKISATMETAAALVSLALAISNMKKPKPSFTPGGVIHEGHPQCGQVGMDMAHGPDHTVIALVRERGPEIIHHSCSNDVPRNMPPVSCKPLPRLCSTLPVDRHILDLWEAAHNQTPADLFYSAPEWKKWQESFKADLPIKIKNPFSDIKSIIPNPQA